MPKINGYTRERGRCWKFCPFSTAYFDKWYNASPGYFGILSVGWPGPTTNPDIDETNFLSVVTSDHPYTNGTMSMKNNGGSPGFICLDDDCQYLLDTGRRYFEL